MVGHNNEQSSADASVTISESAVRLFQLPFALLSLFNLLQDLLKRLNCR
jgi:hypothetical protein